MNFNNVDNLSYLSWALNTNKNPVFTWNLKNFQIPPTNLNSRKISKTLSFSFQHFVIFYLSLNVFFFLHRFLLHATLDLISFFRHASSRSECNCFSILWYFFLFLRHNNFLLLHWTLSLQVFVSEIETRMAFFSLSLDLQHQIAYGSSAYRHSFAHYRVD